MTIHLPQPSMQFGSAVQWDHLKAAKCTHSTFSGNETLRSRKRLAEAFPTKRQDSLISDLPEAVLVSNRGRTRMGAPSARLTLALNVRCP